MPGWALWSVVVFASDAAAPAQLSGPAAYNEQLVGVEHAAVTVVYDATRRMLATPDKPTIDRWFQDVDAQLDASIGRLQAMSPRPDDEGLRDAVLVSFQNYERWLTNTAPEVFDLIVFKTRVRDGDLLRADALIGEINQQGAVDQAAVIAAQTRFAARHGLEVEIRRSTAESPPMYDPGPSTFGPGVPPDGSHLSAAQHASFSLRYQNEIIVLQRQALGAYNHFVETAQSDETTCDARRRGAVAIVSSTQSALRVVPPWLGDSGPKDALGDLLESLETQLHTTHADFCALLVRPVRTQADVDRMNTEYQAGAALVQRAVGMFDLSMSAFSLRFGVSAFESWRVAAGR